MTALAIKHMVIGWLLLAAMVASNASAETPPTVTEKEAITAIEFVMAEDNLQQFGFALSPTDIAERVRANLAEWEYPMKNSGPYSHRLQANLGKISRQETPVGFSFSSGNSDPRASDFQKADVLPVECVLHKTGDVAMAKQKSTFSAHELDIAAGRNRVTGKLIDQISTACFNLLEDLPLPKSANRLKTTLFKPKWMPDVRVEVREVPTKVDGHGITQPAAAIGNEPKKEIIIHNQGTPVIFQFGHERK